MKKRFAIVTPCRNEAEFARKTLESVVAQTKIPTKWVIVDDGSTDETPTILLEYSEKYNFIQVIRKPDRGFRSLGGGVIDSFYIGYDQLNLSEVDYVCKMDLDLDLPKSYFEILMSRMEENPRIGTCSGKPYYYGSQGELISEGCGDEMSVGMIKFYRINCFKEIGGFVRNLMWDGIDCHRCRILGWIACSWDDPEIRFIHQRPMGASDGGILIGRIRHGRGQYFMGTHFVYMIMSALYRITYRPRFIGGAAMLLGYTISMLSRKPRYPDREFRKFLRKFQWCCLCKGKRKATARINDRQKILWQDRMKVSPIDLKDVENHSRG